MALTDHRPTGGSGPVRSDRDALAGLWGRTEPGPAGPQDRRQLAAPGVDNPHRVASLLLAAVTVVTLAAGSAAWAALTPGRWLPVTVTAVAVLFLALLARGHFRVRMIPDTTSRVPLIGAATAVAATCAVAVSATGLAEQPDAAAFAGLLIVLASAAVVAQAVGVQMLRWLWRAGLLRSQAIVLGSDDLARELAIEIGLRREYGVDVVGFVAGLAPIRHSLPAPAYHPDSALADVFVDTGADRLIIGPAADATDIEALRAARWAAGQGIPVFVVPRFYELGLGMDSMTPDRARGYPLVRLQRAAHPRVSLRVKRVIDVVVAGGALLVASPVMVLAALLVKVSSPGPVLFGQERVGEGGRLITVRKFRSMTVSASSDTEWTAASRVTAVGGFLRRSNVDELPQLWSIVRGDMSLVGPRPERPVFVERFREVVPDYDDRHRMPVGLTGLAQIVGLRGDTSIVERVKYDNLYIDQWSVGTDLQILAKTVIAILRQGAYQQRVEALEAALGGARAPAPASARSERPDRPARSGSAYHGSRTPSNRILDLDSLDGTEAA